MRKLFAIGIGTGSPEQLTEQAIGALQRADVVFVLDKGRERADLTRVRREICERHITRPYRWVELRDSARDPSAPYLEGVERWHDERLRSYERAVSEELEEHGCGAILVWGDPSLYDSTLRILERMAQRAQVAFEYEVIPGISSPQVLAARHKISLHRVGGAVLVTTGRRLLDGFPKDVDDVVVMLDGECAFQKLSEPELDIYWGAYLGTERELLVS